MTLTRTYANWRVRQLSLWMSLSSLNVCEIRVQAEFVEVNCTVLLLWTIPLCNVSSVLEGVAPCTVIEFHLFLMFVQIWIRFIYFLLITACIYSKKKRWMYICIHWSPQRHTVQCKITVICYMYTATAALNHKMCYVYLHISYIGYIKISRFAWQHFIQSNLVNTGTGSSLISYNANSPGKHGCFS